MHASIESMTPVWPNHPDTHHDHLLDNLPPWLLKTSAPRRTELGKAVPRLPDELRKASAAQQRILKQLSADYWTAQNDVDERLKRLQDARAFGEPLLRNAIKQHCGLDLDVNATHLRLYIPLSIPWFPIKSGAARTWTVSLLDAALHNFERSETHDSAYEPDSTYITSPTPFGHFDVLSDIKAKLTIPAFTALCRELDIGGQYQVWLEDNLGVSNPVVAAVLRPQVDQSQKAALRVALEWALLHKHLQEDAYRSVLGLVEGTSGTQLHGQPLRCHDLTMMAARLTGIVLFAPDLEQHRGTVRVIAYIPDDPQHPLKEYPSSGHFMTELSQKLRASDYQQFFSRFVDHGDRGYFFANLNSRLTNITWHARAAGDPLPSWRESPAKRSNLQFSAVPIAGNFWQHLYQRKLDKILNDARTLAVSTASADRNARWELWDSFSRIAATLLQVAAFVVLPFVPVLGEMMMAYMAYQLLDEAFESIVEWSEGLTQQALEHTLEFIEAIVQLGAFAAGGSIVAGEFRQVMPQDCVAFIDRFLAVKSADGRTRYWNGDLKPYEQAITLPEGSQPDALGLHHHDGKTILPLDGEHYETVYDTTRAQYQIAHPTRTEAYQPRLKHNRHGAWQTELEQPLKWDRRQLLQRLGHVADSLSEGEREQVLRISGYHENTLRRMHVDQQALPPLLADTLRRFKINKEVQAIIESGASHDAERAMLFDARYRAQTVTVDPLAQHLMDATPGLPGVVAEELLDAATEAEWQQLEQGTVAPRLKELARWADQQVRAVRARESLELGIEPHLDADRAALFTLPRLPGWSGDVRIEIKRYSLDGETIDHVGRSEAPHRAVLVQRVDGDYQAFDERGQPLSGAADLYDCLLLALPVSERTAMRLRTGQGPRFRQMIVEHLPNHEELQAILARDPLRKPQYDPQTMRLPGGADGYPNGHPGATALQEYVRALYPSFDAPQIEDFIVQLHAHPSGARAELSRLQNEFRQMSDVLRHWIDATPMFHPETGAPLNARQLSAARYNRERFANALQQSWRRQTALNDDAADVADRGYMFRFTRPIIGDLPVIEADMSHIAYLTLEGNPATQGAGQFLRRFPGLRRMEVRNIPLNTLPDFLSSLPHLDQLILSNCGITLTAESEAVLASLSRLRTIELYKNPLGRVFSIEGMTQLDYIDLGHTGITRLPPGFLNHPTLETAVFSENQLAELPAPLFQLPASKTTGFDFSDNPLNVETRNRIKDYFQQTREDFGVQAEQADIERTTALYPNLDREYASAFVYQLPGNLETGRVELTRLEAEYATLTDTLAAWTANTPQVDPASGQPLTPEQLLIEHYTRDEFKRIMEQAWRRETPLDDFSQDLVPSHEIDLSLVIHGELPTLSADFSHISHLYLHSVGGQTTLGEGFLSRFPKLKGLTIRNYRLNNLPSALFNMGELTALVLLDCRMSLTTDTVAALAGMEHLDFLDLSGNPLLLTPDISQMPRLATLNLSETHITELPPGLLQLQSLDIANLSDNAIRELPSDLLELPMEIAESINLRGNPFSERSLQLLGDYFRQTGVDFGVEEIIESAEMEVSNSDDSATEL